MIIDMSALREKLGNEQAARVVKQAGFDGVDIMFPVEGSIPAYDADHKAYAATLKQYLDENGLLCNQTHAPFAIKCGEAFDMSVSNYRDIVRAIECASIVGARYTVVHAITIPQERKDVVFEEYNLRFYRSLIPYCERFGVQVAVENLYVRDLDCGCYRPKIGGTPEALCEFIRKIGSPWFVACVDLGHAALVGNRVGDYLRGMDMELFKCIHIHDTNFLADSHALPYLEKFDWDDILSALREIGYDGDFTFEIVTYLRKFPPALVPAAVELAYATGRYLMQML